MIQFYSVLSASTGSSLPAFLAGKIPATTATNIRPRIKRILGAGDTSKPKEYDPSFGTSMSGAGAVTQIKRLTQDDLEKIRATEGIAEVREGVSVNAAYITREGQKKYIGTLQAFNPAQQPELLAGQVPKVFTNKILLPEGYLEVLGFEDAGDAIDQTITVAVRVPLDSSDLAAKLMAGVSQEEIAKLSANSLSTEQFKIAGVLKKPMTAQPGTELYLFIGNDEALALNNKMTQGTDDYQKYASVYARVQDGEDPGKLAEAQEKLKDMGYTTLSVEETQKFLLQFINILQGIVVGFAFLAIIASVFGVINTQYISVLERTQQIGLMKALGMSRRDVAWLFRFEAAWIGLFGGALGSLLALILGTVLNPLITEAIQLGEGNSLLIFEPTPIILLILGLMLVAVVAGILPARKAGKLDPVEALRTE